APYDAEVHGGLVAALQRGNGAVMTLRQGDEDVSHDVSLRGSGQALGFATEACASAVVDAAPADGDLDPDAVRAELVGRELEWGSEADRIVMIYQADGRFEGVMLDGAGGGRSSAGTYEVMADGRVCWEAGISGCFRFYRTGEEIRVRREDAESTQELGVVRIAPL
ncbi:MAG: hypothetical protein AAF264_06340, partial [Pseudomonadota bacterium]